MGERKVRLGEEEEQGGARGQQEAGADFGGLELDAQRIH